MPGCFRAASACSESSLYAHTICTHNFQDCRNGSQRIACPKIDGFCPQNDEFVAKMMDFMPTARRTVAASSHHCRNRRCLGDPGG